MQDTTVEEDETFTVTLSGVSSNAQLATDPTAKGTILDDDDPPDDPVDDSETEEDDLPADTSTTGTVEVGGAAATSIIREPVEETVTWTTIDVEGDEVERKGTVYDFDTDWFAVELEAGRTYRIDMKGATHAGADLTLRLPQINAIYDSDGDFLVNTWSSDESDSHYLFRVTFHLGFDGLLQSAMCFLQSHHPFFQRCHLLRNVTGVVVLPITAVSVGVPVLHALRIRRETCRDS